MYGQINTMSQYLKQKVKVSLKRNCFLNTSYFVIELIFRINCTGARFRPCLLLLFVSKFGVSQICPNWNTNI